MNIALNALTLNDTKAGVGNYAWNVIRQLQKNSGNHNFTVYVNNTVRDRFSDSEHMKFVGVGPFSSSKKRLWYELTKLGKELNKQEYDFVHFLDYVTPLQKLKMPFVVTVHDVSFFVSEEYFTKSMSITKGALLPLSCRRAAGVITVSEFTKRELLRYVPLEENDVFPVLLGTNPPEMSEEGGQPCVLCVGTIEPRKNWLTAIRAMELLWERHPDFSLPLVIAGKNGWRYESLLAYAKRSPYRERIIFTGYCTEQELAKWYKSAKVFLFPSFYEGFGLPPLEAMSYGIPVVSSNAASLPEVLGEAAVFCSPQDVNGFAEGVLYALDNQELIAKGKQRAQKFTWAKTGETLLDCYEKMMERSRK